MHRPAGIMNKAASYRWQEPRIGQNQPEVVVKITNDWFWMIIASVAVLAWIWK